jgi:signal transduction histidine kinase
MQPTPAAILSDRITLTIRWLVLIGLVFGFGLHGGITAVNVLLVVIIAFWNIILLLLNSRTARIWQHEYTTTAIDFVLALVLTFSISTSNIPFIWAGFLPAATGAFYFGLQGGLIVSLSIILIQGISFILISGDFSILSDLWLPAAAILIISMALGIIAQQITFLIHRSKEIEKVQKEERANQDRDRIQTLYQITSTMTATLNYQRVLDMALDLTDKIITKPGDEFSLVSACLLFDGAEELSVRSSRRFTLSDQRVLLPAKQGIIIDALKSGQSRLLQEPKEDPEIRKLVALRECGVVFCYPLRTSSDIYGVLLFGHPLADYFTDTHREMMDIIGRQAMVALQNAELYRNLEREKERIMEIQEEARKQLARDLHDGPTQSVAAIAMRVNFARRLIDRDVHAAGDELFKIEDLARRTTKEIRHMLFTLRPLVLETNGLIAALQSMAEKMRETYSQKVVIDAQDETLADLEIGKQGVIFYIAEEAVNNARKHAEAEVILVSLKKPKEGVILLEIRDNGVGFNVGEVDAGYEKRGSLGMVNMRERTELLNGMLKLHSKVGEGTRIRVWIPLNEDAAELLRSGNLP